MADDHLRHATDHSARLSSQANAMTYDAVSNAPRDALNAFRAIQDWHSQRARNRASLLTENLRRQEMTQRMQMLHQKMGLEERALNIRGQRAQVEAIETAQRMRFAQERHRDAPLSKIPPGMVLPDGKGGAVRMIIDPGTRRPTLQPITDPERLKTALQEIEQRRTRPEREFQQEQQRLDQIHERGQRLGVAPHPTLELSRLRDALQDIESDLSVADGPERQALEQRRDTLKQRYYQTIDALRPADMKGGSKSWWDKLAQAALQGSKEVVKDAMSPTGLTPEQTNQRIDALMQKYGVSREEAQKRLDAAIKRLTEKQGK